MLVMKLPPGEHQQPQGMTTADRPIVNRSPADRMCGESCGLDQTRGSPSPRLRSTGPQHASRPRYSRGTAAGADPACRPHRQLSRDTGHGTAGTRHGPARDAQSQHTEAAGWQDRSGNRLPVGSQGIPKWQLTFLNTSRTQYVWK